MSKTVLITGANRGIGLALTKIHLNRGDTVYAACRHSSDELNDSGAKILEGIDVSSQDCVEDLKNKIEGIEIDILINNAGIFKNETLDDMNFENIQKQLNINAIAPLRLTHSLLTNLHNGSKVGLITSRMGSIKDNGSGSYYGYRMSKAALNAAGKSLANDLKAQGISIAILHPGFVSTRMVNFGGDVSPEESAQGLVTRLDELSLTNTGTFWHANGEVLPW